MRDRRALRRALLWLRAQAARTLSPLRQNSVLLCFAARCAADSFHPERESVAERGVRKIAAAISLTLVLGCGGGAPPAKPAGRDGASPASLEDGAISAAKGSEQSGTASYYADSLAGRSTASGEPYDPKAMTAAHRTLPFGTMVEVTRDDGRKVVVRINDRGPFGKKKRIIDLSRRAAEELGMVRAGVAKVTVRVIGKR